MKLNCNFDHSLEYDICLIQPLANWFARNQEWMAYFELTHSGCLHFEDSPIANHDVVVLGRMANAAFTWLERKDIPNLDRAYNAAMAIAQIYVQEVESLSEVAKQRYWIEYVDTLEELSQEQQSKVKVMSRHNGIKNRRPGKGHRNH